MKHIEYLHDRLFDEYMRLRSYPKLAELTKVPMATVRRMVRDGKGSVGNWAKVERYINKLDRNGKEK